MSEEFTYDVFLSHGAKDKDLVRAIAERLRADGVKVWFDDWAIRPGDSIPAKLQDGLDQSRVLVLCMSASSLGSEWAQLEASTFRFRDPLNMDRRFLPLRLDDTPIGGSLAQFLDISWLPEVRDREYPKLLEACRPKQTQSATGGVSDQGGLLERVASLGNTAFVFSVAWSPDGRSVLSGAADNTVRLWDLESGQCRRVFEGHTAWVRSVAWSPDGRQVASGAADSRIRLWEVQSGRCLSVLEGHSGGVLSVAWSPDGRYILSGAADNDLRLWDCESGRCLQVLTDHSARVLCVAWAPDGRRALSASDDNKVVLWEVASGRSLRVLGSGLKKLSGLGDEHRGGVRTVAWSPDGQHALSGDNANVIRLWEIESGRCLRELRGHADSVFSVAWSGTCQQA